MKLDDTEKDILEKALRWGKLRVQGNIKQIPGWRDAIKGLEEKDLLERVQYGIFEPTDQASDRQVHQVACEDCGRSASSSGEIPFSKWCDNENLSYQVDRYID